MTTSQQAYDWLNSLIQYSVERWMDMVSIKYITDEDIVNRLKPWLKVLNKELSGELDKSDIHTTLDFMWDGQHWPWKCSKCWNRQDYNSHCGDCGRRSITLANGKNDYSLIK